MSKGSFTSALLVSLAALLTAAMFIAGVLMIALAAIGALFFASPAFLPLALPGMGLIVAGGFFVLRVLRPAFRDLRPTNQG